jgi:hypothetical protein
MSSSIFFDVFLKREYKPDNDNNSQTRSYVGSSNGSSHFYECFGIGDLTKDSESPVGTYSGKMDRSFQTMEFTLFTTACRPTV